MLQAQPVQYVQNVIPMFPAAGPPSSAAGPENGATDEERIKAKTDAEKKTEAKEEKAGALRKEVQQAEEHEAFCKGEYEKVAATVDAEMARFQREKLADFKHVVIDFVKLQLEYSRKVHAAWAALLPQLDAIETPPPA